MKEEPKRLVITADTAERACTLIAEMAEHVGTRGQILLGEGVVDEILRISDAMQPDRPNLMPTIH